MENFVLNNCGAISTKQQTHHISDSSRDTLPTRPNAAWKASSPEAEGSSVLAVEELHSFAFAS